MYILLPPNALGLMMNDNVVSILSSYEQQMNPKLLAFVELLLLLILLCYYYYLILNAQLAS